jgi:hypothetical protein
MSSRPRRGNTPGPAKAAAIALGALQESLGFYILRASRKLSHEWINRWHGREHRPLFYCAFALIGANPGISPAGTAKLATVLVEMRMEDERLHQLFSVEERQQLMSALRRVADFDNAA